MISAFKAAAEFYTDERCYIVQMHNIAADDGVSIARARVEPGVTTQLHALDGIQERYVILAGEGKVEIGGGEAVSVRELDVASIPAGVSQRISNTGSTDLMFLCICTPRFRRESYRKLE